MKKILSFVLMLCMLISCVAVADEAPTYTYDVALSEFPTNWNIHQYQTETDAEIVDWISEGFYGFDYNETLDGYQMEPRIASDFPIDVTAEYVGEKWGIAEGETARAWKIPLRDNLAWQDGTPITAEDFVESYKRLLNPQAQNYRADGMWSGNMVVMNAEAYAKQGTSSATSVGALMDIAGLSTV